MDTEFRDLDTYLKREQTKAGVFAVIALLTLSALTVGLLAGAFAVVRWLA